MDTEEVERRDAAVQEARRAVSAHVATVTTAWYGDEPPADERSGTLDEAWLKKYLALRAAEDDAIRELDEYLSTGGR